jgi:hypothetical protein
MIINNDYHTLIFNEDLIMTDTKKIEKNAISLKSISNNPRKARIVLRKQFRAKNITQHVMKQKWVWAENSAELKKVQKILAASKLLNS